jgi:phosphoglycolate phosphatase
MYMYGIDCSWAAGRGDRLSRTMAPLGVAPALSAYDNVVFDCDGVLWHGPSAIPGAAACLAALAAAGKRCFFITNNSGSPRDVIAAKIETLCGYTADPERHVLTAASSTGQYLRDLAAAGKPVSKALVVAEANVAAEVAAAGVEVVSPDPEGLARPYNVTEMVTTTVIDPEIKAVVAGFYSKLSNYSLNLAVLCLLENPGCVLLATNADCERLQPLSRCLL